MQFVHARNRGTLITLKSDGRPQSSNILYGVDGDRIRISVTDTRAKTRNLRRDPRASLHVSSDDFWSYVVVEATAELSPVTTTPGDAAGLLLREVYEQAAGKPHPDWDEYDAAMVAEGRLVVTLHPERAYGLVRG